MACVAAAEAAAGLTPKGVDALLVARCGVAKAGVGDVNPCLKRGLLDGHVQLPPPLADEAADRAACLAVVVCSGGCCACSRGLEATLADVLDQPPYGGCDYEDGGEYGAVQCEDCCGNYVTGLCSGRPDFDSGKFHNH